MDDLQRRFHWLLERPIFLRSDQTCNSKDIYGTEPQQSELLIEDRDRELENFDPIISGDKLFQRHRRSCLSVTALILLGLISGALISTALLRPSPFSEYHTKPQSHTTTQPCGNNSEEALKRGCHFDIISFCWLPDECYDAELSRNFENTIALEWYLDSNRTKSVSHDEVMTGQYTGLYVNWEYHIRHCTAMWKKMHRAVLGNLGNRAIDGYIGVYEHTKHCEHMLLGGQGIAFDTINTRIAVKFPDCGI